MDPKRQIVKPSNLKPPSKLRLPTKLVPPPTIKTIQSSNVLKALDPANVNYVNNPPVRNHMLRRRSKSYTDLSSINLNRGTTRKLLPTIEVGAQSVKRMATAPKPGISAVARKPTTVKRPASDKSSEENKPKIMKLNKPAPYDFKARFNLLNEKHLLLTAAHKDAKAQLAIVSQEIESSKAIRKAQEHDLQEKENKFEIINDQFIQLQDEFHASKSKITSLEQINETLKNQLNVSIENYETLNNKHNEIISENAKLTEYCENSKLIATKTTEELLKANELITQLKSDICGFKNDLKLGAEVRRQLHNNIQDLKGNIRVFCRVRPELSSEISNNRMICRIDFIDDTNLEIKKTKESVSTLNGKISELKADFSFDRVFTPKSTQEEVFEDLSQLIQSALDGYHVCVFAYGQTGSGKTHTMQGYANDLGMIPRSINLIFTKINEMKKCGWICEVSASFLEIYNETVRDLLDASSKGRLDIKFNEGKGASVTNLLIKQIETGAELHKLMEEAQTNRAVASTHFNEHSSRSHAVTKIMLSCRYVETNTLYQGSLNLVDLAGSESVKTSDTDRILETKHINKSLSTLSNVMLALGKNEKHIPYRDSKLTFLLQSCLGGNSKTLMFVNIAPFEDCCAESINSLRFAAKVNQIKTNIKRNKSHKF